MFENLYSICMKICYKCQVEKPLTEFRKKGRHSEKRQSYCFDCHTAYQKEYYQRNKDRALEGARSRRRKIRALVKELKGVPCVDCGESYPSYVMDFDHISDDKACNVSEMVTRTVGEETLRAEVAKCEVVCANCHRERTHRRQKASSAKG